MLQIDPARHFIQRLCFKIQCVKNVYIHKAVIQYSVGLDGRCETALNLIEYDDIQ